MAHADAQPPAEKAPLPRPVPSASRFKGQYALVTGASKGIGKAVAIRLAQEGAHVCCHYGSDKKGAEETAATIAEVTGDAERAYVLGADMRDEAAVATLFDSYFAKWPKLDVMVPNAGAQWGSPSHEVDVAEFDKAISTNLRGYFLCAKAAIRHFLSRPGGGSIVFDSSVHQQVPKPMYLGYACSKAAIGHMTKTLALEYADKGIRVNSVAPGAIETPMNSSWIDDPVKYQGVCSHIPQGRPGSPEEIAAVFAFLASSDAGYITGQTLYACGGLTLHESFRTAWASE